MARVGHLERAQCLLEDMLQGHRDTISYTTVVTALSRAGHAGRSVAVLCRMLAEDVVPNEVTLAGVVMAFARHGAPMIVAVAHGVALRGGLDECHCSHRPDSCLCSGVRSLLCMCCVRPDAG